MTYRGRMDHGVVVLEGDKPADGTLVQVTPLEQPRSDAQQSAGDGKLASHPAVGIWKDRTDLPEDAVQASRVLRRKLMRRDDE